MLKIGNGSTPHPKTGMDRPLTSSDALLMATEISRDSRSISATSMPMEEA